MCCRNTPSERAIHTVTQVRPGIANAIREKPKGVTHHSFGIAGQNINKILNGVNALRTQNVFALKTWTKSLWKSLWKCFGYYPGKNFSTKIPKLSPTFHNLFPQPRYPKKFLIFIVFLCFPQDFPSLLLQQSLYKKIMKKIVFYIFWGQNIIKI